MGDYDDLVFVKTIPPSTSSRVISQDIRIEDDNINEIEQQFALVGELGPEVPEEFACFRVTFGEAECRGRVGTTRIRIRDNDRKCIVYFSYYLRMKHNKQEINIVILHIGYCRIAAKCQNDIMYVHVIMKVLKISTSQLEQ